MIELVLMSKEEIAEAQRAPQVSQAASPAVQGVLFQCLTLRLHTRSREGLGSLPGDPVVIVGLTTTK